jgi:protein-disulfide isomerase
LGGWAGLAVAVAIGILISFILQAIAPVGVEITNSQVVKDAQHDAIAPRVGPAGAGLTVVIFTDYRCPACRRSDADLLEAVKEDGRTVIVFRHRPIFGPRSVVAARTAIAAQWQGKFLQVHNAFMKAPGDLDDTGLKKATIIAGANWSRLQLDLSRHSAEIDALLARNASTMSMLGVRGTPSYLVGNYLVEGGLTRWQLRRVFRDARASSSK